MKEPYTLAAIDEEYYSLHFDLFSNEFEKTIHFYAECSRNPDSRGDDDYYFLELFFSVDGYGSREHMTGVTFGRGAMDKERLDFEIRSFLNSMLDDSFSTDVALYLQKEHLIEKWMDEHYNK